MYQMTLFRPGLAAAVVAACMTLAGANAPASAQVSDAQVKALKDQGKVVFADNCASCHGESGEGGQNAPKLVGSTIVESRTAIINQVLWGNEDHGMPQFKDILSDEEIAAVTTFVRNSWSHNYGPVLPRSVELRR